jgi:hypothetical protein
MIKLRISFEFEISGTFVAFNLSNPSGPVNYGFDSGVLFNGQKAYVGYGESAECSRAASPGLVSCDPSKPGVYTSCSYRANYKTTNIFYLLYHPNLRWVATTKASISSVLNPIVLNDGAGFYFPRFTINGVQYLGKIHKETLGKLNNTWLTVLMFNISLYVKHFIEL